MSALWCVAVLLCVRPKHTIGQAGPSHTSSCCSSHVSSMPVQLISIGSLFLFSSSLAVGIYARQLTFLQMHAQTACVPSVVNPAFFAKMHVTLTSAWNITRERRWRNLEISSVRQLRLKTWPRDMYLVACDDSQILRRYKSKELQPHGCQHNTRHSEIAIPSAATVLPLSFHLRCLRAVEVVN